MSAKVTFFVMMLVGSLYAQQDAQYTQYMYNTSNVNPAYAGARGAMSVFLLHRSQWVGLDGAPVTNTASVHAPVGNGIGLGLSVVNDRIGISDENDISADVSYTFPTSPKWKLSFGIKATANLLSVDFSRLTLRSPEDYAISQQDNIDNKFTPNLGAGLYWHSESIYFGLSVPHFLETRHYKDNTSSVASEKMHVYFIAGKVFQLNDYLKFKPALLSKIVNGAPLQVDVSGNFLVYDKLTLGVAYRWKAAMSAQAGFQITDGWFIGYGYDLETTQLAHYNSGSHELFLRYELFRNYDKILTPRFF